MYYITIIRDTYIYIYIYIYILIVLVILVYYIGGDTG